MREGCAIFVEEEEKRHSLPLLTLKDCICTAQSIDDQGRRLLEYRALWRVGVTPPQLMDSCHVLYRLGVSCDFSPAVQKGCSSHILENTYLYDSR